LKLRLQQCSAAAQEQASKNINTVVIAVFLSFFPRFSICFLCNPSLQNGEKRRAEKKEKEKKKTTTRETECISPLSPVVPLHPKQFHDAS
jgi:hypothetical protein